MFFETQASDREHMGMPFEGMGEHAWTQVKLGQIVPFFLMEVGPTDQFSAETWLVGTISCLLTNHALLQKEFPVREVATFLVSPAQKKQGGQWLIEPLAEVWERQYGPKADPAFRYVLSDGRVLVRGPEISRLEDSDTPPWERRF